MLGSSAPVQLTEPAIRGVLERPGVLQDLDATLDARVFKEDDWTSVLNQVTWISGAQVAAFAGRHRSSPTTIR